MAKAGEKAIVHLLVRDDKTGPIRSMGLAGHYHGREMGFYVACTPSAPLPDFASGESASVNCPLCLATADWSRINDEQEGSGNPADVAARKAIQEQEAARESDQEAELYDQTDPGNQRLAEPANVADQQVNDCTAC